MKKLLGVVFLCGCTTVGSMQADCESGSKTFPELSACLNEKVANSRKSSGEAKLYALKSRQLTERVQRGEISDLDARVELQQLYVDLMQAERSRRQAASAAARSRTTNCYAVGNSVQCNTY